MPTSSRPALALASLLVGAGSCVVCDDDCRAQLTVTVREAGDLPLAAGTWTFTVVRDAGDPVSETCDVSAAAPIANCDGDLDIVARAGLPGTPLQSFEFGFEADEASDVPAAKIDVRIDRNDEIIYDEQHTPNYDDAKSGQCADECNAATVDIRVDD
ncbi:MAG TPA: hypothetical protein VG755_24400 [Nannocystaceae bacterium]|nr:hypothetical protein [Nannocystaceae bacterium]